MAPVPEDNQEKPPSKEDSDLNTLSNPNLAPVTIGSDSSDDENYPEASSYMLLPQDPGDVESDSDDDIDNLTNYQDNTGVQNNIPTTLASNDASINPEQLPDEVIRSETGASAPMSTPSNTSLHPDFLAKFPDGKLPSYMQIPDIPSSNSKDILWNKMRVEKATISLDSSKENNILKAMSNFALPSENVPEWARNMSEEEWSKIIIQQIKPVQINLDAAVQIHQGKTDASVGQETSLHDEWVAEFPDS